MCSLVGLMRLGPTGTIAAEDIQAVRSALDRLRPRGPDQEFTRQPSPSCLIAGNRLIVRGNELAGRMPFENGACTAAFNGQIYNFREFTEADSDGYSILNAYLSDEHEFPECLDGEFALSIWDEQHGVLTLARDRFGTKPLFFGFSASILVWASSARIVADLLDRPVCPMVHGPGFRHTYASQEPYTSFQGVWSLPPGHLLHADAGGLRMKPFTDWPYVQGDASAPQLKDSLWASLRTRLAYEGTLAIPLSAGIDSAILSFAAKKLGLDFHVYSVVSVFGRETEEAPFIKARLDRLNPPDATLIHCTSDDYHHALSAFFEDAYYDSEYLDNGAVLTYCVASAVKANGLRVLLDGAGGDELFNGYRFRRDLVRPHGWPKLPFAYLYGLFTTLLPYVAKVDRAGGYHSLETRYPLLSSGVLRSAMAHAPDYEKRELRRFLLREVDYGEVLSPDLGGKYGFSMRGHDVAQVRHDIRGAWTASVGERSIGAQTTFPFAIGQTTGPGVVIEPGGWS